MRVFLFKGNKKILHLVSLHELFFVIIPMIFFSSWISPLDCTEAALSCKNILSKKNPLNRTHRTIQVHLERLERRKRSKIQRTARKTEGTRSRITASKLNTLLVLNVLLWTFFILNSYSLPYPLTRSLARSFCWAINGNVLVKRALENWRENANLNYNMRGSGSNLQ